MTIPFVTAANRYITNEYLDSGEMPPVVAGPSASDRNETGSSMHSDVNLRLSAVGANLDNVLAMVEGTFLAAGQNLGTAVDALQCVTATFDRLAGMVASEDLDRTARALDRIPDALAAAAAANGRSAVVLRRLDELANGLAAPLARLRKTVGEVHVLAINGRVEVAHVHAVGTDFSVFTRGMGGLASQATAALDHLGRELEGLTRQTTGARTRQDSLARQEGEALAEVARRLRTSVDAIAVRRQETGAAARLIGDLSRANAASVAQAVGALQIGDIARQRVEHVATALKEGDRDGLGPLCRLQGMQLDHTRQELGEEVRRARATFVRLTKDAGAIQARAADSFRSGSDGSSSFLDRLAADLRVALAAMDRYHKVADQLRIQLEPIVRTVAEIAVHVGAVRSIEADMRIMGLNATFKCSRLGGQGRALGVIAQALRAQASHTAEFAGQVMAGLEEISAVTRELGEAGAADAAQAVATLNEAVATFATGGEMMTDALASLGTKVETAITALVEVQRCFDPDAMLARLDDSVSKLAALADDLGAPAHDGRWGADLPSSYTMASQREIHARFSGTDTRPDVKAEPVSVDDFFF